MQLDEAIPAVQKFMLLMTADKTIPLPGDVDIMTGGPPCQVSSLRFLQSLKQHQYAPVLQSATLSCLCHLHLLMPTICRT
jgi:hypothetical protein